MNEHTRAQNAPRVLMYSPDSIGLGHMRRHSSIAESLAQAVPGISNLMIVGSAAGTFFEIPECTDSIKLPSLLKTAANCWQARSLNVADETMRDLRAGLICSTVETYQPDVFIVDHVPAGIWHELVPALRKIQSLPNRPHVVLGLRDILGAPTDVRQAWKRDGVYELIEEYYDEILIYGCRDLFPAAELYGLTERFSGQISYCGYIQPRRACLDPQAARAKLGMPNKPVVVVTAGGGHDAYPMMKLTLDAIAAAGNDRTFAPYMITGPLMPAKEQKCLHQAAKDLPVNLITSTPDLPDYLSAADLVVTMGGYNTLMECVQRRKRTIVIPRTGPSAEQRMRANLFAELRLANEINLATASANHLLAAITDNLENRTEPFVSLSFNGLQNATQRLSGALNTVLPDQVDKRIGSVLEASAA